MRETREEVGVDLRAAAKLAGRLDDVRAIGKGQLLPMAITPFVFILEAPVAVELGPEAIDHFWLPLEPAASGSLDAQHRHRLGPVGMGFPCWRYRGHDVWGLTYGMLTDFLRVMTE